VLRRLLIPAYAACDLIVDIGCCMSALLDRYQPGARHATLTPWALLEPANALKASLQERHAIFGNSKLALMYSGSFGRAHSHEDLLDLARALRHESVHLAFSIRGNQERAVRAAVTSEDINVSFMQFAASDKLEERLAAADIHIVSLREEWTGAVVPSKFFGALAAGRPVIFCGSPRSAIAHWIEEYKVGWVLAPGDVEKTAQALRGFMQDTSETEQMNKRCHCVYREQFAKKTTLDRWDRELRSLLDPGGADRDLPLKAFDSL
jgi:colanic acid biosynthesis glycosyl transferase WcaI